MSNYKVAYYTDSHSTQRSAIVDVEIGRSTRMIGYNKGLIRTALKTGNIVAIANNQNNLVQLVRVIAREQYAQPWKVDYKHVYRVEFIGEDILVSDDDKEKLFLSRNGKRIPYPSDDAQTQFVKTVLESLS